MRKIVFMMTLFVAMVSLTSLQAAEQESTYAMSTNVAVGQVTSRMARQLALSEPQRMKVLALNMKYHYLFEGHSALGLSDRQYRKALDKYEAKLRRILTAPQFTLYLSHRGALYAGSPRPTVPRVTVPRPQPVPRVTVPQGRNRQPMASSPRGNNRPQAGNGRSQGNRPSNRPQAGNGRPDNERPNFGNWRSRSNPQQKSETPEEPKEPTNEQDPI